MHFFRIISLLLVYCFFYYSCVSKQSKQLETYLIPKKIKLDTFEIRKYYKTYNFIIDFGAKVYFFQQDPFFRRCGFTNWWEEVAIPKHIDLSPKDLVQVPENSFEEFLEANILGSEEIRKSVSISSTLDTVSCSSMTTMMKIFQDTANHVDFILRKTTQEENFVLERKKWPGSYNSLYGFKWDSTKTLFFDVIDKIETDQVKKLLDFEEAHPIKKSMDDLQKLHAQTSESALHKKLADALKLQISDLFDFEL